MSETLYLIAHKVRGESTFDVAIQMICPHCGVDGPEPTCNECDGQGFWWMVATSGHRAHPWWEHELFDLYTHMDRGQLCPWEAAGPMPDSLPDHYAVQQAAPTPARPSGLAALLARSKPQALPLTSIARRGF